MRMHEHNHARKRGNKKRPFAVNTALRTLSLLLCPGDDIAAATIFSSSAFKNDLPPVIMPDTRLITVYEVKSKGKRVGII